MSVFRVERTHDYTVMSNHHLKNRALSLKAKGLLSLMLSLPDDWDYTLQGLAHISLEKVDAVRKAIIELENEGYITRTRQRDEEGKLRGTEYIIREQPISQKPVLENPILEKPTLDKPTLENPTQLNNNKANKNRTSMHVSNIHSNQSNKPTYKNEPKERIDLKTMKDYEGIIKENIDYDALCEKHDRDMLDELVTIIVETVCTSRESIRVASDEFPAEAVKAKLLKLENMDIEYVFDCLNRNTTQIRNIRQYLLTALFNAPRTISNYYCAQFNHDFCEKTNGRLLK